MNGAKCCGMQFILIHGSQSELYVQTWVDNRCMYTMCRHKVNVQTWVVDNKQCVCMRISTSIYTSFSYAYMDTHMYIHIHIHIYTYMYVCVYIYIYIYVDIFMCLHVYMYLCIVYVYVYVHAYVYVYPVARLAQKIKCASFLVRLKKRTPF